MTKLLKKAAEILVEFGYAETGYADYSHMTKNPNGSQWVKKYKAIANWTKVGLFADTLEGRRQADAIEDWLDTTLDKGLWKSSEYRLNRDGYTFTSNRQWRLDRIKWCLKELCK